MSTIDKVMQLFESSVTEVKSYLKEKGINTEPLEDAIVNISSKLKDNFSRKDKLELSRHTDRPYSLDYIDKLFTDITFCHGDRIFGEDPAIVTGFAKFQDTSICFMGHQKGRDLNERQKRRFGMANPEGYRKTARVFKLAERFNFPIITFIDTPGAYPGIGAEERGQACAIAENLELMSNLKVPVLTFITGEGGSGGALALSIANEIHILEHSILSVISPEGCASILWKDQNAVDKAINSLKFCADDLINLKIVNGIIQEETGAHKDIGPVLAQMETIIKTFLTRYTNMSSDKLIEHRFDNFRKMGEFKEVPVGQ